MNAAGFSSELFDAACRDVLTSLPDMDLHQIALDEVTNIYREELPSLSLLFRRDILLQSTPIGGISDSLLPTLWDIESLVSDENGEGSE